MPVHFRNTQNASTELCGILSLLSIKVGRQAATSPPSMAVYKRLTTFALAGSFGHSTKLRLKASQNPKRILRRFHTNSKFKNWHGCQFLNRPVDKLRRLQRV